MLAIVTTHPIQYQTPIWQALAADGRIPFEVWYLTRHGVKPTLDRQFGTTFSWDIDTLSGYPYRFLETPEQATPNTFWRCRLNESLRDRLRKCGAKAMWVQGWQVAGYWQAVRAAKAVDVDVWLRGESNDLAPTRPAKRIIKRAMLGWLFGQIDQFLCIGSANERLYRQFGIGEERMLRAPYAVDNDRFARQALELRARRAEIRREWGVSDDAFCLLFCGKFIPKKRPMDLIAAATRLRSTGRLPNVHLLFAGAGELAPRMREASTVIFDAQADKSVEARRSVNSANGPPASFVGFLNQTEISRAYVAADCLVLPSDHGETWGLVVNEAMASGLRCIASDACGCSEDLLGPERTFPMGNVDALATRISNLQGGNINPAVQHQLPSFSETVAAISEAYARAAKNRTSVAFG